MLLTIDRRGSLSEGKKICLSGDFHITPDSKQVRIAMKRIHEMYPDGISEHGDAYLFGDGLSDTRFEWIFEYIRRSDYPEAISRFQAFFAFEENDIEHMIKALHIQNKDEISIYELVATCYERCDMSLLTGDFVTALTNAHLYWKGQSSEAPLYEYLVRPPLTIGKRR